MKEKPLLPINNIPNNVTELSATLQEIFVYTVPIDAGKGLIKEFELFFNNLFSYQISNK
jgi:hypothetical protein